MTNKNTALIINDIPDQLEILKFILRQADYHVLTAHSGNQGFEIAQHERPDLIISDVMMPDGDGIELCRLVRADDKLRSVPILLVSAMRKDTASVVEGLREGADDYMQIPYEPLHLIAKAARLIERKRMEDALRESENRFRNLIENVTDIITVLAPDGTIVYESPSLKIMLGYEPEELIGRNAFEFVHPEDSAKVMAFFNNALQTFQSVHPVEYRFRHRNNSWLTLESVGKPFNDPVNGLVAIVNSRDITKQKKAQESLQMSEERFRLASLATEDALWDWNLVTDSLWLSEPFYDLLGLARNKAETHIDLWYEVLHPEDKERVYNHIHNVIESGEHFWTDEYRMLTADGSYAYIFNRGYIVRSDEGKPVRMIGAAINFTKRKQAELTLRFQKTLLEAQSEASIDGILVVSPTGEIISHNHRFMEMWGISDKGFTPQSEETILKSVTEKLTAPQEFLDTISYLYENPFIKDQVEIPLKDGRIFERYTAPVLDADNTHFGRVWFIRDITKHKQVENAIRFQAHLLDTVEQAVIATDLNGVITYWNQFAHKLYGWTAVEAVGRDITQLTTPEIAKERAAEIMARLTEGKGWSGEFLVKNKDGKFFPAYITNSPVNDSTGKLIGIVGVSIDITERKEAENALAEANQRAIREYDRLLQKLTKLAQTTGTARDLITVFRAILEFTQTALPCTGFFISLYDADKQVRTPAFTWDRGQEFDVSKLPSVAMSDSPSSRAVSTGKVIIENDFQAAVVGQPIVNIGPDKDLNLPQSCLVVPMAVMGRIVGAAEVQSTQMAAYTQEHAIALQMAANVAANAIENVRLLEQEQQSAEQLRLSQKLESVGRLAGGIAHDFNNMLTAIKGYSDLTLRRLKEGDPLRRNIEEIKKASERSASLTHQLLAFSRRQVLKPKVLDLNEVIIDTSKMLQRLINEDIELNIVPNSKLGLIEADPGQLTQVIINLAVNARDAMPHGGELTIETSNVHFDHEYTTQHFTIRPGSYVVLAFTDTGVGMDDEVQQHVFEPFFTTKEVGRGTGLGLATVYGIVKQSGGYIQIYSEVGKGSTFKIYLPRVDEDAISFEENKRVDDIPSGNETILLVEDEEIVRNLSRQILESCGYRVLEASNGVEALSICQKTDNEIDLLMTDVVMPQMGGRELAEKLVQLRPQMRLLFTSGYTDDTIIRQGVIEADTNFIQKPFTFERLAKKVRELLDEKK